MPRKSNKNKAAPKKSISVIFWIAFFIVVSFLFFYNRENIRRTIEESITADRLVPMTVEPSGSELILDEMQLDGDTDPLSSGPPAIILLPEQTNTPAESGSAETMTGTVSTAASRPQETPSAAVAPALRERAMYFISVDRDGIIIRNRVNRSLPVTDTPLTDTLSALLGGPSLAEQQRGLISLIPEGTRIINMEVRGSTVYINFSEDFQFNVYGVEGYAAALRQIIWTATEFPNIEDVQILIQGRRIDFLGEGVWIGSPLNREMY